MDKQKLLEWMEHVETMTSENVRPDARRDARERAFMVRREMENDATCASVTDRPDTPPPSSWPSVSRIRKETRAEVVGDILGHLRHEANEQERSVVTVDQQEKIRWYRAVADVIAARYDL